MNNFGVRLLIAFLWLLHLLPLPALRALGAGLGRLLYAVGRERREVALTNLRLCFPQLSEAEREALARRHFIAFSRAVLDRTLGWWASEARLRRLIRLNHPENLHNAEGRPLILLCPHFVGLDAGGTRITMERTICSVYAYQKNELIDQVLYNGRRRFSPTILLSRQEGLRRIVRALKEGYPFYYLPDLDFGPDDSIFVPFFGVPAATVPGVSRLARLTGARVVPCIARQVTNGYEIDIMPALENFPGESIEADTRRINALIEEETLHMPEQYFWLHKRFKTRPPGEQRFYK